MSDNVDSLREGYQAFARGDMEAVAASWDPDIEFDGPNSSRMPNAGTHRGKADVARLLTGMRGGMVRRGQALTDTAVVAAALGR